MYHLFNCYINYCYSKIDKSNPVTKLNFSSPQKSSFLLRTLFTAWFWFYLSVFSSWLIWEHLGLDSIETRLQESGNCSSPLLLLAFSMPLSATLCEFSHGSLRILSFKPFSARVNTTTLAWESVVSLMWQACETISPPATHISLSSYMAACVRSFGILV